MLSINERDPLRSVVPYTRAFGFQPRQLIVASSDDLLALDSQRHPVFERFVLTNAALSHLSVDTVASGCQVLDALGHSTA
jgi:hypothetical protein